MKVVIQRVSEAMVERVSDGERREIGAGYLVLLGIKKGDSEAMARKMANKVSRLRLMADEQKKMNVSLQQAGGEMLIISQFTLIAEVKGNNRPSFAKAEETNKAKKLYEMFVNQCKENGIKVEVGFFGEYMNVKLNNDGPVSLAIDETEL